MWTTGISTLHSFNGFVLGDLDFAPGEILTGLSLENSTLGGYDETKFGLLSDDTIWINLAGTSPEQNDTATLRFVTQPIPIPEPAQAATFAALGVLALAIGVAGEDEAVWGHARRGPMVVPPVRM